MQAPVYAPANGTASLSARGAAPSYVNPLDPGTGSAPVGVHPGSMMGGVPTSYDPTSGGPFGSNGAGDLQSIPNYQDARYATKSDPNWGIGPTVDHFDMPDHASAPFLNQEDLGKHMQKVLQAQLALRDQWATNQIAPWRILPRGLTVSWNATKVHSGYLDTTPEESIATHLTVEHQRGQARISRMAKQLIFESGWLQTEEGRQDWMLKIVALRDSILMTAMRLVLNALVNCQDYYLSKHLNQRGSDLQAQHEFIKEKWAILAKHESGEETLVTMVTRAMKESGVEGGPDTVIGPAGMKVYIKMGKRESRYYYIAGPNRETFEKREQVLTFNNAGLAVFEAQDVLAYGDDEPYSPLRRERTIGLWAASTTLDSTKETRHRTIRMYNEYDDSWGEFTMEDMIYGCNRFNEGEEDDPETTGGGDKDPLVWKDSGQNVNTVKRIGELRDDIAPAKSIRKGIESTVRFLQSRVSGNFSTEAQNMFSHITGNVTTSDKAAVESALGNISISQGLEEALKKYAADAGPDSSLYKVAAIVYLTFPVTRKSLLDMCSKDILIPLGFIFFRPTMQYRMYAMIFMKRGASTASTFYRTANLDTGKRVSREMIELKYSIVMGCVVYNPLHVHVARDVIPAGYIGGNDDTIAMKKRVDGLGTDERFRVVNDGDEVEEGPPASNYIAVTADRRPARTLINVYGKFSSAELTSAHAGGGSSSHYAGSQFMKSLWQDVLGGSSAGRASEEDPDGIPNMSNPEAQFTNHNCWRGVHGQLGEGGQWNMFTDRTHWGPGSGPGSKSARGGGWVRLPCAHQSSVPGTA